MTDAPELLFIEGGRVIDPASRRRRRAHGGGARRPDRRGGRARGAARRRGARRRARALGHCPGWSTCTCTCASPATSTRRPSPPARGRRWRAASPPSAPCPTPPRPPTRPASASSSAPGPSRRGWPGCTRWAASRKRPARARSWPSTASSGDAGCVALSDDGRPVASPALMRRALEYARAFDLPVSVHEEDLSLTGKGVMHEGPASTRLGLHGIPAAVRGGDGDAATWRCSSSPAAASTSAHLSCAGSVRAGPRGEAPRAARSPPRPRPHHLTLTDEDVAASGYDTAFKMNPPLRSAADVAAVREGLADGTIDCHRHRPRAPLAGGEGGRVRRRRRTASSGWRRPSPVCLAAGAGGRSSTSGGWWRRSPPAPARAFGLPGGHARGRGPRPTSPSSIPRSPGVATPSASTAWAVTLRGRGRP